MKRIEKIISHYEKVWKINGENCSFNKGPVSKLPSYFTVMKFKPHSDRKMWTFATCGMSYSNDIAPIELHIFSPEDNEDIVELLFFVAYFHRNFENIGLWHTVNFGRPWLEGSLCDHGLISLPYLDGPNLENLEIENTIIKLYWLIPITESEVKFKIRYGIDSLEEKFEEFNFNYIDSRRKSVV